MFKLFKWILGVAVTVVVLLVLAILIIPQVVDPNDYRQQITEMVKEQTGRDLSLDGDLSISVFPWLGIRTQGLQFSQPAEIGGTMVAVDKAQLRVKVAPLFSKRVEIDTVVLQAPEVNIVTLKNGIDSFSGLADSSDSTEAPIDEQTSSPPTEALALVIQGLALSDGQLIWDDRQAGSRYEVRDFNLISGDLIGDKLANIKASGVIRDAANPDVMTFKLDAQARIDTETLGFMMQFLKTDVTQGEQTASLQFDQLTIDQRKNVSLSELSADVRNELLNGQVLKLEVPMITANLDDQRAHIDKVSVKVGDMLANLLDLNVVQFSDAPSLTGRLDVPVFNALNLLNTMDVEFEPADSSALKAVAVNANFSASEAQAKLDQLVFNLDESRLSGNASVSDFENPKINFDLKLDQLNLDNYLSESEESSEDSISGAEALAVPMAAFKDVFANGRFKAEQLISGGLELNDVDVDVKSTPGNVTITPRANLYDGKFGGAVAYSDEAGQQQLRVQNEIDLVDLSKMLNAAEVTDQLSGIGSLQLDLLVTEKDGVQSNSGTIKLLAKNGALKGVDLKAIVDKGYAQYQSLKGREPNEEQAGDSETNDETRFAELIGTFNIKDFKITNNDFSLKAPLFRVGGEGEINIDTQTLNYLVNLSIVNTSDGQGGEALEKLKGLTLPIRFSGDLSAPRYSLDTKALYRSLVKRELDEKKGDYLQEKFGIEGGENLSTKDTVKQLLLNKLFNKDEPKETSEPPSSVNSESNSQGVERPLFEANEADGAVPDVTANSDATQEAKPEPVDTRSEKDKLKEELAETLLDSLFN